MADSADGAFTQAVQSLRMAASDQVRAVVVIEHRNLGNKMLQLASKGEIDWRGILFVFVSPSHLHPSAFIPVAMFALHFWTANDD